MCKIADHQCFHSLNGPTEQNVHAFRTYLLKIKVENGDLIIRAYFCSIERNLSMNCRLLKHLIWPYMLKKYVNSIFVSMIRLITLYFVF